MSLRLLLTVLVAGALVAASVPMIDAAQRAQAEADTELAVERIEAAADDFRRHNDPVPLTVPAARQTVPIRIPPEATETEVILQPSATASATNGTRVRRIVRGSSAKETILKTPLRPLRPDGTVAWNESISLHGSAELTLRYRTVEGQEVITVSRGFK